MLSMQAIATHWGELPPREQQILLLRFRGEITQAQIGLQLGLSRCTYHGCSRTLWEDYLRPRLLGMADRAEGRMIQAQLPMPELASQEPVLGGVLTVLICEEAQREPATAPAAPAAPAL